MNALDLIRQQINELTDFNADKVTAETPIDDVGLASLDYVSIQIATKKAFGIKIDLDELESLNMKTIGDFANHIDMMRRLQADAAA